MAYDSLAFMDWDTDPAGVSVLSGEFVVVTPEGADHEHYAPVAALLERIHKGLGLYTVLVSQTIMERPVVRYVDAGAHAVADPLELAYARTVLQAHDAPLHAVPVVGHDGSEYGTLCCLDSPVLAQSGRTETQALQSIATLVAQSLDRAAWSESGLAMLQPAFSEPAALGAQD